MWVISKSGFISIVQHRDDPEYMLVRARVREDLVEAFPDHEIEDDPKADYRYRVKVGRSSVGLYLLEELDQVDYDSHAKENMTKAKEPGRYKAYMNVWHDLLELQPGGIGTGHLGTGYKGWGYGDWGKYDDDWGLFESPPTQPLPLVDPGWSLKAVGKGSTVSDPDENGLVGVSTIGGDTGCAYADDIDDSVECALCQQPLVCFEDGWEHIFLVDNDHKVEAVISRTEMMRIALDEGEAADA